jgi:hypothetical protein
MNVASQRAALDGYTMVATGRPPFANELIAAWQARRDDVRAALERDPEHLNAWLWRIQERILTFLLARYADDESLSPPPAERPSSPPQVREGLGPDYGEPPKSRDLIRRVLERIAEANRDVWN